jgi:hypothetical protein
MGAANSGQMSATRPSRQVLSDDSCYFVRQGDVDGLLEALTRISSDPDDARRRARTGVALAKLYDIDAHMTTFASVVSPWLAIR